jgi:hypothetical protein
MAYYCGPKFILMIRKTLCLLLFCALFSTILTAQNPYPIIPVDSVQYVNTTKLGMSPVNDSPDYVTLPSNSIFRDTVRFEGIVATNPQIYALSTSRKAAYIQKKGGGPWSGVLVLCEPAGTGLTLTDLKTETQFYNNFIFGHKVRVTGTIKSFQGETQVNLIRDNPNFSNAVETISSVQDTLVYTPLTIDSLMMGNPNTGFTQQKFSGEKWEGVMVQFNDVTIYSNTNSGNRSFWSVIDDAGNVIDIRDMSGYFRRDDNEDTIPKIANTFYPPAIGTRLSYIRGIITEYLASGIPRYGIYPIYPEDVRIEGIKIKISGDAMYKNNAMMNLSSIVTGTIGSVVTEIAEDSLFNTIISRDTLHVVDTSTKNINVLLNANSCGYHFVRVRAVDTALVSNTFMFGVIDNTGAPNILPDTSMAFMHDSIELDAGSYAKYIWSTANETSKLMVTMAGDYSVVVMNTNGCAFKDSTRVVFMNGILQNDTIVCEGSDVLLTAGNLSGTQYLWSTSETTASIRVQSSVNTTYTCQISLGSFSFVDSVSINVNALPVTSLSDTAITFEQDSVLLIAGSGSNSYLWSTGDTTVSIWAKTSGDITVEATSDKGCKQADTTKAILIKGIADTVMLVCEGVLTQFSIDIIDGAIYLWSTGDSSHNIVQMPLSDITYSCNITVGSYAFTDSVKVKVASVPNAIGSDRTIMCRNESIVIFGPDSTLQYKWYANSDYSTLLSTAKNIAVHDSGLYNAILIDTLTGCADTSISIAIELYPYPMVLFHVSDTTSCFRGNIFTLTDSSTISKGNMSLYWDFGDGNSLYTDSNILAYGYAAVGVYTIKLKRVTNNGCADSVEKVVRVKPSPIAGLIAGPTTNLVTATPYLYNVNQQLNHQYTWSVENGNVINGQGTNAIMLQWLSNGSGRIHLEVMNTDDCTDTAGITLNVGNTGLNEAGSFIRLSVYPNPSNGTFTVQLEESDRKQVKLSMMNSLGKEVWSGYKPEGSNIAEIETGLTPGVYMLRVSDEAGFGIKQVIIK